MSLRSLAILRTRAPWTSAGWFWTLGYCVAAAIEFSGATELPAAAYAGYACLALLTIAFIVAGVRDEPQAEPWWWPRRLGATRAEKRS